MTKYVFPSISISALLSSYYSGLFTPTEKRISSVAEAIEALNANERTDEAIRFLMLQHSDVDNQNLRLLSARSIGALALRGWPVLRNLPVEKLEAENKDDLSFEELLEKFDLGKEFQAALDWLNRVPCEESDLSCTDAWFGPRPSQTARLHRILQVLFLKSEASGAQLLDSSVVNFLFTMYKIYNEDNKDIAKLALKTLSNLALSNPLYASKIIQSEWLPLLSEMIAKGRTLEHRIFAHKILRNALFSLGMIDYCLRSDIYELSLPDRQPLIDIVLIHGLRGSVGYTWRQKDDHGAISTECWPKDWLPADIPEPFRIIGIDYPSYLIQFTGTLESLQARADRFKQQLADAGIGRRPVVFICHSMGGLLAKKLLVDVQSLADKTVGVLFIATPHRGSPIATSWSYEMLYPSEDVRFLRESNETNRQLNDDFSVVADNIPIIVSMIETKESPLIGSAKGIIVPTESAVYSKGTLYHIDEVHHNVCKPSERTSPQYGVVLNFVRDAIQEAKKLQK